MILKTAYTLVATACIATVLCAENHAPIPVPTATAWKNSGWAEEEAVLSRTLAIRAKTLEKLTGISFGSEWKPKVSLEWSLGAYGRTQTEGQYMAETQTIYFTVRTMYELNVKFKTALRLLDPEMLAKDEQFGTLADHELGHALADAVSRRVTGKPFFTVEQFETLSRDEALGINIIAEGIGTYFGALRHPSDNALSEVAFPTTLEEQTNYTYDVIAFQGGQWLVSDILSRYGDAGMVWLVTNPLIAKADAMRAAVVAYRTLALSRLASFTHPRP